MFTILLYILMLIEPFNMFTILLYILMPIGPFNMFTRHVHKTRYDSGIY